MELLSFSCTTQNIVKILLIQIAKRIAAFVEKSQLMRDKSSFLRGSENNWDNSGLDGHTE